MLTDTIRTPEWFEKEIRKVIQRAICERNIALKEVDWSALQITLNPPANSQYITVSLRPKTRLLYYEGTAFRYKKVSLRQWYQYCWGEIGFDLNRIDLTKQNTLPKLEEALKEITGDIGSNSPYLKGLNAEEKEKMDDRQLRNLLDTVDVDFSKDFDFELNVTLVKKTTVTVNNKKLTRYVKPNAMVDKKEMIKQAWGYLVQAGEDHPYFTGELFVPFVENIQYKRWN